MFPIANEFQALTFGISLLILLTLTVLFHEIGHYIAARAFGFKAKFGWGVARSFTIYEHPDDTLISKMCIISFAGVLGAIAVIPFWLITRDTNLTLVIVAYNLFYSIFETVLRYRKEIRQNV